MSSDSLILSGGLMKNTLSYLCHHFVQVHPHAVEVLLCCQDQGANRSDLHLFTLADFSLEVGQDLTTGGENQRGRTERHSGGARPQAMNTSPAL